jgi:hypothetical protein
MGRENSVPDCLRASCPKTSSNVLCLIISSTYTGAINSLAQSNSRGMPSYRIIRSRAMYFVTFLLSLWFGPASTRGVIDASSACSLACLGGQEGCLHSTDTENGIPLSPTSAPLAHWSSINWINWVASGQISKTTWTTSATASRIPTPAPGLHARSHARPA